MFGWWDQKWRETKINASSSCENKFYEFDRSKTRNYKLQLIISWCDRYQYDFLFRPWRRCKNFEALFFPHQKSLSLNSISVTPDLSRHRKHFFNKKRERDGTVSRNEIFFIFAAYSWTRSFILFRVLIEWLRQPRVKNWNNAFLAKQRWMTIWQECKKCNSFIGETKNRIENLKQNYVAF